VFHQDCVSSSWKLQRASFVSRRLKLPLNNTDNFCNFNIVFDMSIRFLDALSCNLWFLNYSVNTTRRKKERAPCRARQTQAGVIFASTGWPKVCAWKKQFLSHVLFFSWQFVVQGEHCICTTSCRPPNPGTKKVYPRSQKLFWSLKLWKTVTFVLTLLFFKAPNYMLVLTLTERVV